MSNRTKIIHCLLRPRPRLNYARVFAEQQSPPYRIRISGRQTGKSIAYVHGMQVEAVPLPFFFLARTDFKK